MSSHISLLPRRLAAASPRRRHTIRTITSTSPLAESHTTTLLPSVQALLHQHNIPATEAAKIPTSGPGGRLLKGDVLAYIGHIDKSHATTLAARLAALRHLDLHNIKLRERTAASAPPAATAVAEQEPAPPATEIAVSISLAAALACQKRIRDTLAISLPLSTFIARAVETANDGLPRAKGLPPSADELFHAVLGLDGAASPTTRGAFVPTVVAAPRPEAGLGTARGGKLDIIDVLTGKKTGNGALVGGSAELVGQGAQNVFSVSAGRGEEKRAMVFLERMKAVLELEPGRLVL